MCGRAAVGRCVWLAIGVGGGTERFRRHHSDASGCTQPLAQGAGVFSLARRDGCRSLVSAACPHPEYRRSHCTSAPPAGLLPDSSTFQAIGARVPFCDRYLLGGPEGHSDGEDRDLVDRISTITISGTARRPARHRQDAAQGLDAGPDTIAWTLDATTTSGWGPRPSTRYLHRVRAGHRLSGRHARIGRSVRRQRVRGR